MRSWVRFPHPALKVVRVDGIDTAAGNARPRQLGTYPSQRAARAAAAAAIEAGHDRPERGTVAQLVDEWIASRTHASPNQAQQYRWAARHINAGLGAIALARLERSDVSTWLESLAQGGRLSRRSIQIIRMTLRAAMANAVASGDLRRNLAAHVPMPSVVTRIAKAKDADAWDGDEIERFVAVARDHRWGGPILLQLMYGLRRSELLALHWSSVELEAGTIAIVAGLVESDGQLVWSEGKNARSRRRIALDPAMIQTLREHRRRQAAERIRAGEASSSPTTPAARCSRATTTTPWTGSPPQPESLGSRLTGYVTPQRPTWSPTPPTWARFAPRPTSSATAPRCS